MVDKKIASTLLGNAGWLLWSPEQIGEALGIPKVDLLSCSFKRIEGSRALANLGSNNKFDPDSSVGLRILRDSEVTLSIANLSANLWETAKLIEISQAGSSKCVLAPGALGKYVTQKAEVEVVFRTAPSQALSDSDVYIFIVETKSGVTWTPGESNAATLESIIAAQCNGIHSVRVIDLISIPQLKVDIIWNEAVYYVCHGVVSYDITPLLKAVQDEYNSYAGKVPDGSSIPSYWLGIALRSIDDGANYYAHARIKSRSQLIRN